MRTAPSIAVSTPMGISRLMAKMHARAMTSLDARQQIVKQSTEHFQKLCREKEAQAENARLGVQHAQTKTSTQAQAAHTVIA